MEYTEYRKKLVPNILYIQNIWKPLFLVIFVSFVSFVICLVFRKIWFWRNMKNAEYGIKLVSSFAKLQKSEYSAFRSALSKGILITKMTVDSDKLVSWFVRTPPSKNRPFYTWLICFVNIQNDVLYLGGSLQSSLLIISIKFTQYLEICAHNIVIIFGPWKSVGQGKLLTKK